MKRPKLGVLPSVKSRIYRFIRDYGKKVRLHNVQLFSKIHNIKPQDMGFALKTLQQEGRVKYTSRAGWYTVKNPGRLAK